MRQIKFQFCPEQELDEREWRPNPNFEVKKGEGASKCGGRRRLRRFNSRE
jgi:hypothetical protein